MDLWYKFVIFINDAVISMYTAFKSVIQCIQRKKHCFIKFKVQYIIIRELKNMKLHIRTLMILGTVMLMFFISTNSVQAFDLDPGDSSSPKITVQVTGIRLAQDGDLFSSGELYMTASGVTYYDNKFYAIPGYFEDDTVYSSGFYYGKYYDVPYPIIYESIVYDLGHSFCFELWDEDAISDTLLWRGYIRVKEDGLISTSVWSLPTKFVTLDLGPIELITTYAGRANVGSVFNQLCFSINYLYDF